MTETKKVLVTGATGMQGGAVVQALLRRGHSVTGFVRTPESAPARALAQQGVELATGNLEDLASLETASAGHDAVFSVQLFLADPADFDSEQRQARNVATAAKRAGVTQLIHTSVSGTGWRSRYPGYEQADLFRAYWDNKEAAEDAVRQSGVDRWTIFKPAWYMDNVLPGKRPDMFPDLPEGQLVTATGPQTAMALINAEDLGAAVAAAVVDPDTFHEAEIEFAGDVLTFREIAETISAAANRKITAVFRAPEEWEQVTGTPYADGRHWDDVVGYPARPYHADRYGLTTTTMKQWAARQDWRLPIVEGDGAL
ncbi:NmrA/HSCARG family protein [Agromyces silvae]|uniref:NmrA/HSCARG family protein n=1 Tax=Agromyces silvae TaxID=3388266 RepID=UPI00280BA9E8|nr:NmrA/HSCARG family protein [Agromyces protaetiae]